MDTIDTPIPEPEHEEEQKAVNTQLWAAYMPFIDEDGKEKKNYLGDGSGHLRLFRSERELRDWLEPQMDPTLYASVVVHPIEAKLALPPELQPKHNLLKSIQQPTHLMPLTTVDRLGVPNALELLHSLEERQAKAKKNVKRKRE